MDWRKDKMIDGIITEWGYDDGRFNKAKQEIFEIINKYQISLSDTKGLFSSVMRDIEMKNIVNL